jgi:hypothetical protein
MTDIRIIDPRHPEFIKNLEYITHPGDSHAFAVGRDACGPFVGLVSEEGIRVDPNLLEIFTGPAARRAGERLREEQEKDRREGVQYPGRCGPPVS